MSIASLEYDSKGRLCRFVRSTDLASDALNRIVTILEVGHRFDESDVNWCRRDQCHYIDDVGSWTGRVYLAKLIDGTRHRLWARDDITFSRDSGEGEMLSKDEITALGYDLEYGDQPELPFLCDGGCYYCERCNDMLPDQENCEHFYWCDDCGVLGDNRTDRCSHYCDEHECQHAECDWLHGDDPLGPDPAKWLH